MKLPPACKRDISQHAKLALATSCFKCRHGQQGIKLLSTGTPDSMTGLTIMPDMLYMAAVCPPPRKVLPQVSCSAKPMLSFQGILPRHSMVFCARPPASQTGLLQQCRVACMTGEQSAHALLSCQQQRG